MIDGMFENWPTWLRWIVFIPFAVIGSLLVAFIISVLVSARGDAEAWVQTIQAAAIGYLFVVILSGIAPAHKFPIALVGAGVLIALLCVLTGFVIFGAMAGIETDWTFYLAIVGYIVGTVGGVVTVRSEYS